MAQIYKDECLELKIEDDIIFGIIYTENITLSCAQKIVDSRYKIAKGKTYATLIDISRLKSVTKEARDFLAEGKAVEHLSATALYTNSAVSRLAANFFLSFNKPNVPSKVFTNEALALSWLKEMKQR